MDGVGLGLAFTRTVAQRHGGSLQISSQLGQGSTFTVQDENANSNFLNNNVLSTLSLYKMNYKITHIVSSGLTSKNETTRPQSTKPTAAATKSNDQ